VYVHRRIYVERPVYVERRVYGHGPVVYGPRSAPCPPHYSARWAG
jgi:hypothetical protein